MDIMSIFVRDFLEVELFFYIPIALGQGKASLKDWKKQVMAIAHLLGFYKKKRPTKGGALPKIYLSI